MGFIKKYIFRIALAMTFLSPQALLSAQSTANAERFEDYQKIVSVLKQYIIAIDTEDEILYAEAFAEKGAIFELRGVIRSGREEIKKEITDGKLRKEALRERGEKAPSTSSFHMMSNSNIVFIDENTAKHNAYYLVYEREDVAAGIRNTLPINLRAIGRYDDDLVKIDDKWFIKKRLITPDTSGGF